MKIGDRVIVVAGPLVEGSHIFAMQARDFPSTWISSTASSDLRARINKPGVITGEHKGLPSRNGRRYDVVVFGFGGKPAMLCADLPSECLRFKPFYGNLEDL